ncbi:capsular biosynthesis protein [Singulisphaera sp. PoT]|uniref:capsular polysaccharide export protein, LipB/KpsS family n=1 Tax=Singulisphaera sp. PoT TaxID=3411797 RepID=UPI003BF5630D
MKDVVVLLIDSLDRYPFMLRIANALRGKFDFIFVTTEPLAAYFLRQKGESVTYLNRGYRTIKPTESDYSLSSRAIETLNGEISPEMAARDLAALRAALTRVYQEKKVTRCVAWNGQQLIGRASRAVCKELGIATAFIEIANLPDKMFSDPQGVNAESDLFANVDQLDGFAEVSEADHAAWMQGYEAYKSKPLPQAKSKSLRRIISATNHFAKAATGGLCRRRMSQLSLSRGKATQKLTEHLTAEEDLPQDFIFLPLQVTADTQLKLHSEINNLGAIDLGMKLAKESGLALVVKVHPAEVDGDAIDTILRLQQQEGFILTNANTTKLIRGSARVITINSTVGLEALMYGRPLTVLGRALYRDFDQVRVRKYIHGFLVSDVDYFGSAEISSSAAAQLIGC